MRFDAGRYEYIAPNGKRYVVDVSEEDAARLYKFYVQAARAIQRGSLRIIQPDEYKIDAPNYKKFRVTHAISQVIK